MDDDDADYMQGSDDEVIFLSPPLDIRTGVTLSQDYGLDYSDGDEADEAGDVDVENLYYTAKCMSRTPV